jgi:hypothetical protein
LSKAKEQGSDQKEGERIVHHIAYYNWLHGNPSNRMNTELQMQDKKFQITKQDAPKYCEVLIAISGNFKELE